VQVEVDASGVGFGEIISASGNQSVQFTGTLSETQVGESSTAREMRGYEAAVEVITQNYPSLITGS
jgi:hypothetical protein